MGAVFSNIRSLVGTQDIISEEIILMRFGTAPAVFKASGGLFTQRAFDGGFGAGDCRNRQT